MDYDSLKKAWSNYCFRAGKQAMDPITVADIYSFLDYQDRQQGLLEKGQVDVVAVTIDKVGDFSRVSEALQKRGIFMKPLGNWTRLGADVVTDKAGDIFVEVDFKRKTSDIFKYSDRRAAKKAYKVICTTREFLNAFCGGGNV